MCQVSSSLWEQWRSGSVLPGLAAALRGGHDGFTRVGGGHDGFTRAGGGLFGLILGEVTFRLSDFTRDKFPSC